MAASDFTQVGARFNRLEVVGPIFRNVKNKHWYAPCRCICGSKKNFMCKNLVSGGAISCGCARHERKPVGNMTHGASGSPAHRSYWAMMTRCHNPNAAGFYNYGGRGIQVCERWRSGFELFLADMGERPDGTTLDRIDHNGNYEPFNCRWATDKQQRSNKRVNVFLDHDGRRQTISQWASEVGLPDCVIRTRLGLGWPVFHVLTRPSEPGRNQYGRGEIVECQGQFRTWPEWAKEIGIDYQTLKKRMGSGWTVERTLTQPLRPHRRK